MKNKKIKFICQKGGMRFIDLKLEICVNELDENFKLLSSETLEIFDIYPHYQWINRESDLLFQELEEFTNLARDLCEELSWKPIASNMFSCVWKYTEENKNVIFKEFWELQKRLNAIYNGEDYTQTV